jgi:pyruvate dehydrogenase E1 component alpha subunit
MGHEEGNNPPPDANVLPVAVPIASQIPHATGAAWAKKLQGEDGVVLCYFGDGATSEGDFHEGLNFAGVFDAPTVFLCENNGWAISLPERRQTASDSIAVKADAYGIEGVRVDGNDPLATRAVVEDALERAREDDPVLVEALTYRQGAHTTADDPSQYREGEPDLPEWRVRDPLDRFVEWCRGQGVVEEGFVERATEAANEELADAVETAESVPRPEPEELFDPVYEELSPELRRQREAARAVADEHGEETYELER